MQIAGNGGYDMGSERLHAHMEGHDILLSKFVTVQRATTDMDGVVSVVADANGTMTRPGLKANLKVTSMKYRGQGIGEAAVEAHSNGETVYVTANSTLVGAKVDVTGQAGLTGDYPTQAKLTIAGLDIGKPIAMFGWLARNLDDWSLRQILTLRVRLSNGKRAACPSLSGSQVFLLVSKGPLEINAIPVLSLVGLRLTSPEQNF